MYSIAITWYFNTKIAIAIAIMITKKPVIDCNWLLLLIIITSGLLPNLLQPQEWMVKMELKDAYLQIPIHPDHQHLLTFHKEGKTYMFAIPTYLSLSSTQGVHKTAEDSGGLSETEWLSSHNTPRSHANAIIKTGATTTADPTHLPIIWEFGVNGDRRNLYWCQLRNYIGFHLCSVTMRPLIPPEKLRKIQ